MIQFSSIIKNSDGSWTFTWQNQGAPFYRAVLYGLQLGSPFNALSFTYGNPNYTIFPPPVEIVFGNQPVLSETYTPYIIIQWYADLGASAYLIQQYVSGAWVQVAFIQDTGQWVYSWRTPVLQDQTLNQFRVIAVDSLGNQATPRNYSVYIVTPPVPPDGQVQISYTKPNVVVAV